MQTKKAHPIREFILKLLIISVPFNSLGSPIPLVGLTLFIVLVFIILYFSILLRPFSKKPLRNPLLLLITLYAILLISSAINYEPLATGGFSFLRQFPTFIIMFYILSYAIINSYISFKQVMINYLWGMAILSFLFAFGISVSESDEGRMNVLEINSNALTVMTNTALLFILNLIGKYRIKGAQFLMYICFIPVLLFITISTGSRGGFFGLIIAIFVYFFFLKRNFQGKIKYFILGAVLLSLLTITFLSNELIYNRIFNSNESLANSRLPIWEVAYSVVSNDIFIGVGLFEYQVEMTQRMGRYFSVHNEYLAILIYSGILGFSLFIRFLYIAIKAAYNAYVNYENPIYLSLLALLMFALSNGGAFLLSTTTWFLIPIIMFPQYCKEYNQNNIKK